MGKRTPKIVKCRECGSEFSSWGHKSCSACRTPDRYDACPECGDKKYKRSNLCAKCSRSRENNGNWGGGKTQHSKGYIYVRVKDHPKVPVGKAGYVAEHVLVMEQHIGRFLEDGENVHHLNGLRSDNRIENLELWCKPQPTGCRAEDAYKYALEIVERYRSIFD